MSDHHLTHSAEVRGTCHLFLHEAKKIMNVTLHLTASLRVKVTNENKNDDTDLGFVLVDVEFTFALERKFTKLVARGEAYSV